MLRRPPPNRPGPPTADTLPTHDDNSPGGLHGLNLDAKDDDGFEERWARPQVSQANTPKVIVGTSHSHTNIDVYLNTFSDGNWLGATVNIYAKTMNGRALVSTATTANPPLDAQTQRFTASGAASEGFDVEVILATPSSTTAAVTAIAYGWEGNCCTGGSTGGITQLTNQVIAGPGSGSVVAKIAAQETPVAWVSTTGSDVTGNGNLFNPFATYAKASTVLINEYAPTAAAMAVVRFEPGTYLENIALKPNVALSGDPSSQTILSGVMSFDASFTGAGRIGVAFANLAINGGFDADFVGAGASDAFLQYLACAFHTTSYNGGGTSSLSRSLFVRIGRHFHRHEHRVQRDGVPHDNHGGLDGRSRMEQFRRRAPEFDRGRYGRCELDRALRYSGHRHDVPHRNALQRALRRDGARHESCARRRGNGTKHCGFSRRPGGTGSRSERIRKLGMG